MEQKRTLWILLASGIFLLVVIGVALILYAPKTEQANAPYSSTSSSLWVDSKNTSSEQPSYVEEVPYTPNASQNEDGTDGEPYSDFNTPFTEPSLSETSLDEKPSDEDGTTITVTGEGYSSVTAKNETTQKFMSDVSSARNSSRLNTSDSKNTQIYSDESKASSSKTEASEKLSRASYKEESPSEKKQTKAASKTSSSSAKTSTKTTSKAKAAAKEPDRFWVQAGSFESHNKADEARALLTEKGMQCEVFTFKNDKGVLFFRVRVGPYTTKTEADFWKKEIEKLEQFKGAYVINSTTR